MSDIEDKVKAPEKTTLDWMIADVSNCEIEVTDELRAALVHHAKEFLIAGGTVSWERWAMLGKASREAFMEAASELRIRSVLESR